jgi:hypothetical protein
MASQPVYLHISLFEVPPLLHECAVVIDWLADFAVEHGCAYAPADEVLTKIKLALRDQDDHRRSVDSSKHKVSGKRRNTR